MALGDLEVLGAEIGEKHDRSVFNRQTWCYSYKRDCGDLESDARHMSSSRLVEMAGSNAADWVYIYSVADGTWWYTDDLTQRWFDRRGETEVVGLLTKQSCEED